MTAPQFADISVYQSLSIDWQKYKAWSSAVDGIARVSLRSSYGTGVTDAHYKAYRSAAEAAGIQIIHYHYCYPSLNQPEAEADWQRQVVGDVRAGDLLMLDIEENVPAATADWAYRFLSRQEQNYGRLSIIYASDAYVRARLQDSRLARYPLVLANWTYDPSARPACPPPWKSYTYLQYSDKATVPGIPGAVDANVYLGGGTTTSTTTSGGENAVFIDNITQLEPNETEDACVAFSAANVFYSTQPGTSNSHTSEDVDQLADKWYTRETGSITNSNGISVPQLQDILNGMSLLWETIPITSNGPANDEAVRAALRSGKLVIVCAAESSFFDLEIGRPPYSWNTQPFNHCIVVTGNITSGPWQGNVWVRDTVAVSGGYPPSTKRPYDIAKMQYVSLTAVTPSWLTGGSSMPVPTGWTKTTVNGQARLVCPNGHYAIAGIAAAIENNPNYDPANTLNEEEYQASQVQLHNLSLGPGSRQTTKYGAFWFTLAKGVVYEPFGGLELKACYDLITQQDAKIASLQVQLATQTTPIPNVLDAVAQIEAAQAAAGVIATALGKAHGELKQ